MIDQLQSLPGNYSSSEASRGDVQLQGVAKLTAPRVRLTSKRVQFVWGEKQDKAFGKLQWFLTNAPMLALPDPDAPYNVVCDACGYVYGLGAVLLQNQKPIAYHSDNLQDAELCYPVGEQELIAVIFALKQWRGYLGVPRVESLW